ncbi:MAG: type II toxin-antitoxin system RelE/ParE family toxin [Bacteroidales bacterium]|jgi:proteic killer suppression protein|nr:type II toxin-antitoxin system RelE/ParE family toxin [Bacteroidales bacterium]
MEIQFDKQYLQELYEKGKSTDKKYRFQPQIISKYRKIIDVLEGIQIVTDLFRFNSLRYEKLQGNKKEISSVRINDQYRIEFAEIKNADETVVVIFNILELSNHYK